MSSIDNFSRIELSHKEVFKSFLDSNIFTKFVSPFFSIENFTSSNSGIDANSYFSLKCSLIDILQFFVTVKEIVPDQKIVFELNGLIKGVQTIYFLKDGENSTVLREKFEFSLYNQFNLPILSLILSIFFYIDGCIKHFRLKNLLYKTSVFNALSEKERIKDFFSIRSYIVVEADIDEISSLFQDINKFSLWLSPFVKINPLSDGSDFQHGKEFLLTFSLPVIGSFQCRINKNELNKVDISFSNPILSGVNVWSILPCDKEIVVENVLEIDDSSVYMKLIWLFLGNSLVRFELDSWNKRLKEIVEKTNLYKDMLANPSSL